jgi:hypothetical protein
LCCLKTRENDYAFYVLRAVWCLPNGRRRGLAQYFGGGFFNQTKERQQIGKSFLYNPSAEEVRGLEIFVLSGDPNFEHRFKKTKSSLNLKNLKYMGIDVLS